MQTMAGLNFRRKSTRQLLSNSYFNTLYVFSQVFQKFFQVSQSSDKCANLFSSFNSKLSIQQKSSSLQ